MGGRRFRSIQDEKRPNEVSDRKLFYFAFQYLKPYKLLITGSVIFIIVSSVLDLLPELLIRKIFDEDIANKDLNGLFISAAGMISIYFISWVLNFVYTITTSKLGQSSIFDLRRDMYKKLLNQSQSYFDKNQSGKINSKLTNDIETLSNFLGSGLVDIIAAIIQLSGIIVIMLFLDVPLALISFSLIPLLIALALFVKGPVRRISQRTRKTIAKVTDNLAENISGAKTSKTFAREKRNQKEFEKVNKENYQASMKATKLFAFIFPMVGIISAIGTAAILGYAGYQNITLGEEVYTVGILATFMAYLTRFFRPVFRISMFYSVYQTALASLERIYLFFDEPIEIIEQPNASELVLHTGEIIFDQVYFSYEDDVPIFENLDVEIKGATVTALVGETGAGKSSFIKLIPRFYDTRSGRVMIDDQDIKEISLDSLREHIGIVPQSTHLFNTTILDNLRYGTPDASEEKVIKFAKMMGIHDFISKLPEGYQTNVNEDGSRLSQGQRQLISFTRSLIKDPKILILDEATSSLDPISEIRVQEALEKLIEDRTVIIIAHRLSTIRNADRILVLDEGKIIQDGNHTSLLMEDGKYKELYIKQFLGQVKELEAKIIKR